MNLLNQTLNSFSTQISDSGISLNTDIFEANLVNLFLLAGGLFYLISDVLSKSLSERQQKILKAIQDSEERLEAAATRLAASETQMAQAQMVIDNIETRAQKTCKQLRREIFTNGQLEVTRINSTAQSQMSVLEARVRREVSNYVSTLVLQRITAQFEKGLNYTLQQQIIDRNIYKLVE